MEAGGRTDPRIERLSGRIAERGWPWRSVPLGRLADLREAIRGRYADGLLFEPLYREQLGFLSYEPPAELPRALARCASCVTCARHCPTGAITEDRFLIHAERCLTYHDEAAADFPAWIDPAWHHCLVGCMCCQDACPENRAVRGGCEDRGEFSERETALLLARTPRERLPGETAAKLAALGINAGHRQLCRNLAMVLEPRTRGS
jgi:ferredoxin